MSSDAEPRAYTLRERARRQEETRRRIVEATVELHRTVGPAATTISGIAGRAGVTRPTVYAHFPDERSLFAACQAHGMAQDPPPDPAPWAPIRDPEERLRRALSELYPWYRRNEQMNVNVLRDVEMVPALADMLAPIEAYNDVVTDLLAAPWRAGAHRKAKVHAAIAHAIDFHAWRSMAHRLEDSAIADLMLAMVRAAAGR